MTAAKLLRQARTDQIIKLFEAEGGLMSTRTLAQACLAMGLFDEEWEATVRIRAAVRECREALTSAKDANGIRRYGQTTRKDSEGATVWAQRDLWDVDDYRLNIHEHVRNRDSNHEAAVKLRDECRARFRVNIPLEAEATLQAA